MIKFRCKSCGQQLSVRPEHSGKRVKCPKCGSVSAVPDNSDKIEFHCKNCGKKILVSRIHAGKKGRCPKCQNVVIVPELQDPSAVDNQIGSSTATDIVRFRCPMCDKGMQAPESSRGELLECPNCGSYAEVPKKEDIRKEYAAKPQEQKLAAGPRSHVAPAASPVSDTHASQVPAATSGYAPSRPVGITVVVVLADIGALLRLIACILIIAAAPSRVPAHIRSIIVGQAVFGCAIALGILVVGHFLWRGANWARITFLVIHVIGFVLAAIGLLSNPHPVGVIIIAIALYCVVALNSAAAKDYCGAG